MKQRSNHTNTLNEAKYSVLRTYLITNSLVQLAITVGISYAAIYFDKISILWFYLIPACCMSQHIKIHDDDNKEDNND